MTYRMHLQWGNPARNLDIGPLFAMRLFRYWCGQCHDVKKNPFLIYRAWRNFGRISDGTNFDLMASHAPPDGTMSFESGRLVGSFRPMVRYEECETPKDCGIRETSWRNWVLIVDPEKTYPWVTLSYWRYPKTEFYCIFSDVMKWWLASCAVWEIQGVLNWVLQRCRRKAEIYCSFSAAVNLVEMASFGKNVLMLISNFYRRLFGWLQIQHNNNLKRLIFRGVYGNRLLCGVEKAFPVFVEPKRPSRLLLKNEDLKPIFDAGCWEYCHLMGFF